MTQAQVAVGRVLRPHGVHGEVLVEVRTDDPATRFAPGSVLHPLSAGRPLPSQPVQRLTVLASRAHGDRLLVKFAELLDRTEVGRLRGNLLLADARSRPTAADPDEFWDHELVGLAALTVRGEPIGAVVDVLHPPSGVLLAVRRDDGRELLVPFVRQIVPLVDTAGGRLQVDPPPGLLEL